MSCPQLYILYLSATYMHSILLLSLLLVIVYIWTSSLVCVHGTHTRGPCALYSWPSSTSTLPCHHLPSWTLAGFLQAFCLAVHFHQHPKVLQGYIVSCSWSSANDLLVFFGPTSYTQGPNIGGEKESKQIYNFLFVTFKVCIFFLILFLNVDKVEKDKGNISCSKLDLLKLQTQIL